MKKIGPGRIDDDFEPLTRLADRAPRDSRKARAGTHEDLLADLVRQAAAPDGLDAGALARVRARLQSRGSSFRFGSSFALRAAVAATFLLIASGVVGASAGLWRLPESMSDLFTGPSEPPAPRPVRHRASPPVASPEAVPVPMPQVEAPMPQAETTRPVLPVPHRRVAARRLAINTPAVDEHTPAHPPAVVSPDAPSATPAPAPSALTEESVVLGRALTHLRRDRDAAAALAELDGYLRRFPDGVLAHEAAVARVEALLLQGRSGDAHRVLTGMPLGSGARDRELRLVRAELAADRDCGAAAADFDALIDDDVAAPVAERALWGKAVCLSRLKDEASARGSFRAYLDRFPTGPHAGQARERLDRRE